MVKTYFFERDSLSFLPGLPTEPADREAQSQMAPLASRSLPSLPLLLSNLVLLLLAYSPAPTLAADSSTSCAASGVVTCASALIGKLRGAPDSCAFQQEYYGIIADCKEQCTTRVSNRTIPSCICASTFSPDTCAA